MLKDFQKFKRGQVWWVDPGPVVGHVIDKKRPMIIVSDDDSNASVSTLIVAPVTSQSRPKSPFYVEYTGPQGRCVVLCNQLQTVDVSQVSEYEGCVSEKVMASVEEGICASLTLKQGKVLLKDIQDTIEGILTEYLDLVEKERCYISADDIVDGLKVRLSEMKTKLLNPSILETPKQTRSGRGKTWTEETMLEYIIDADSMSPEELMAKWDIKSRVTAISYKSKFKKRIESEE